MKPREAYSILATAVLCIGFTIAQDQLFECPRGKFEFSRLFLLPFLLPTSTTYFCYHPNWLYMEYDEISKICFSVHIQMTITQ